jgi:hypothetical protein
MSVPEQPQVFEFDLKGYTRVIFQSPNGEAQSGQRCECNPEGLFPAGKPCTVCRGVGWLRDTLLGRPIVYGPLAQQPRDDND